MKKTLLTLLLAICILPSMAGDDIKTLEKKAKKNNVHAIVRCVEYWVKATDAAPIYYTNADSTAFKVSQEKRQAYQKAYQYMQQLAKVTLKKEPTLTAEAHFAVGQWIYIDGDEFQSQNLQLPDYKSEARRWWQKAAELGSATAVQYLKALDETGNIPYNR
ncbi:MAG: hypothetical protein J6I60_02830 [Bacteroidaceae bacterium]|nr:hypothetical protein [Bacteroidaceae bacterium]